MNEQCKNVKNDEISVKTKTAFVHEQLTEQYVRKPPKEILKSTRQKARAIVLARAGMLECGKNFKGKMPERCTVCGSIDDEDHRMNHCVRWKNNNRCEMLEKIPFSNVYSDQSEILDIVLKEIEKVWMLDFGSSGMRI